MKLFKTNSSFVSNHFRDATKMIKQESASPTARTLLFCLLLYHSNRSLLNNSHNFLQPYHCIRHGLIKHLCIRFAGLLR